MYCIFETLGNEDSEPRVHGPWKTIEDAEKEFFDSGEGYMTGATYILFEFDVEGTELVFGPIKYMAIPDPGHNWQEVCTCWKEVNTLIVEEEAELGTYSGTEEKAD